MAYIFISLATAIHFYIFAMESLLWGRPKTNRAFKITPEQAETNRLFAFNQGFYNLFLALAALAGMVFAYEGRAEIGRTLMVYASASMFGAAAVLFYSQRRLLRAALIQGLPPLLALIAIALGR